MPPAAWYQFSQDRRGAHPKDHLSKYRGWMQADNYAGYEGLYRDHGIKEVACMAHIRRKFVDVHRSQGSAIAEEAILRISQLYAVEKEARGSPPDQRAAIRQAQAAPVFENLQDWLGRQLTTISGKSPLAHQAIRYALTRMRRFRPYLAHGILELDHRSYPRLQDHESAGIAALELRLQKRGLTITLGIIASTPAAAEVCDKVRPAWPPADGPITEFEDLALFFIEPLGLIVFVFAIVSVLLRKVWFTVFVVTLLVAIIALNISTWIEADDVTNSAISEGCIAAPVLTTITLIAICAIISVTTWHSSRRRKRAV